MKNVDEMFKISRNPIYNSNIIIQTLNGLEYECNPVVVKLFDQTSLNSIDMHSQLLSFESRIEQLNSLNDLTINASTNMIKKTNNQES